MAYIIGTHDLFQWMIIIFIVVAIIYNSVKLRYIEDELVSNGFLSCKECKYRGKK